VVDTGNRRTVVTYLAQNHQVSITRDCKTTGFSKSPYYYQSKKDYSEVVDKLNELVDNRPNRSFPYFFHHISNEGYIKPQKSEAGL
jgi:putative transposase